MLLKASPLAASDFYRGVVRLGKEEMEKLWIEPGDAIAIKGKKLTAARVWRGKCMGKILMDNVTARNAGITFGNEVEVERIEANPAKRVVLAGEVREPWGWRLVARTFEDYLKVLAKNRVIVAGDELAMMVKDLLIFKVVETKPTGVVSVGGNTVIDIKKPIDTSRGNP
jgi:transitional endoplasmic reticulum ATPase